MAATENASEQASGDGVEPGPRRDIGALVDALTLEEKAAFTAGVDFWHTASFPRLGIPAVKLTDGPNGARGETIDHRSATPSVCIPSATALAATWDPAVAEQASAVVARQALDKHARVLLAPTVNLHRHPLWGRSFECFSEDPVLTGTMAVGYIRGVQDNNVVATVKHFVGNETEFERNTSSSEIDERTLRELYLLPFEYAVRVAGVLSVMTGYNRINGRFTPNDPRLITDVLRREWGFDGFVMTDWFGVIDTEAAAEAGLDLEMPGPARGFGSKLADAVRAGALPETVVDAKLRRALTVFDRVGALDEPVGSDEHPEDRAADRAFCRAAATDGIVLLSNDGLLPLDPASGGRLAVIGPNVEKPAIMGGGSARVVPHYELSVLDALAARLGTGTEISYERGVADETGSGAAIERAVQAATGADAVVVVVGTDGQWESEGYDRPSMALPGDTDELVSRVLAANPRTVVVVNSGSPVHLPWSDRAPALIQSWFAGQELANALVDVLFGDAEPGGRLPTTVPLREEHAPAYGRFPGEASKVPYGEGLLVGYRWYETRHLPVRFPFGHGLSYTSFEIGTPKLSTSTLGSDKTISVEVPVTNTGSRPGAEVVQLYVAPPGGGQARPGGRFRPVKELKAFAKVRLAPGETTTVSLRLVERSFAYYDTADEDWSVLQAGKPVPVTDRPAEALHRAESGWYVDAGTYQLHIGRSSAAIAHVLDVTLDAARGPLAPSAPLA